MKKESLYVQWKEHRRQVNIPDDFAAGVMAEIENQVGSRELELPARFDLMHSRLAQWGMAAGLVLVGLFRILYIAANLIRISPLMPY